MGVNGLNSVNFYELANNYVNSRSNRYSANGATNLLKMKQTQTDTYVSEQGNTCTDGKDDGKVGLFSAIGNIFEGAIKGVWNGIKGMVTDENGHFSLLKTVKTVAMGAACIAFPAVGLVACGIGVVSGGAKLVKGVSTALGAKTDAEAKDAWEAVGDGGLTVAVSALGARASYHGVVKGASMTTKGSAIEALEKDATLAQKAGALLKDMGRSTKNSWNTLTDTFKILKARKTVNNLEKKLAETTPGEQSEAIKNSLKDTHKQIKKIQKNNKGAKNLANEIQDISKNIKNARANSKTAKANLKNLKTELSEAKKLGDKSAIQTAREAVKGAKSNVGFGKLTSLAKSKLPEGKLRNVISDLKANKNSVQFSKIFAKLSEDGQAVIEFLKKEKGSYYEAVKNFGYKNVLEALEAFAGYRLTDETV